MKLVTRFLLLLIIFFSGTLLALLKSYTFSTDTLQDPDSNHPQYNLNTPIAADELNTLIGRFTQQNVSCYPSPVAINPFWDAPSGNYPTPAPGKQLGKCTNVHFSPVPLPRTALASYQGSGNTWVRHLIHELTGVHTGSIYTDDVVLQASGFVGEGWINGSVVAVKTHGAYQRNISTFYERGILLIRNPFHSLISEFNRRRGKGHTALATEEHFKSQKWTNFVTRCIQDWHAVTKAWLRFPNFCLHVIQYEDLVQNVKEELVRLAVFLGVDRTCLTPQHLNCVLQNSQGMFKRKKRPMDLSVFTKEMNSSIRTYANDVKVVAWNKKRLKLDLFR